MWMLLPVCSNRITNFPVGGDASEGAFPFAFVGTLGVSAYVLTSGASSYSAS